MSPLEVGTIDNPYASGVASIHNANSSGRLRHAWPATASVVLAGVSVLCIVVFFVYIALNLKEIEGGRDPNFVFLFIDIGAWVLCAAIGFILGLVGLFDGRARWLSLFGMLLNLVLVLSIFGLYFYGKSAAT